MPKVGEGPLLASNPSASTAIRERLGVPHDAERVLILGESSHWDPNWLYTSEEYYTRQIEPVMDSVLSELDEEPRRVFSLESVYFLRMYWERRPDKREGLRRHFADKSLRLTGSGMTTPDTVLPATESIIRDYLHGQRWLNQQDLAVQPAVAYLPDDFGVSPGFPAIARSLGIHHVCITRIDGMHFVASDYRPRSAFPRKGSSAERLQRELQTLDFVWKSPDASEVLCHWNAFTYFQGDMLAYKGIVRWMGRLVGVPWRTEAHIARRIAGYVRKLGPLSRTPYLFCPIGCDFNPPIPRIWQLIDRYNQVRYPDTGVYLVNAGLDDYLELVDGQRSSLPTVELDPNPYWMGFYGSRPEAKTRCNRIVRKLILAEKLSAIEALSVTGTGEPLHETFAQQMVLAWDNIVLANHHDFITGTSPDRVWRAEQQPLLQQTEEIVDRALAHAKTSGTPVAIMSASAPPSWHMQDGVLTAETDDLALRIESAKGGALTRLWTQASGEMLEGLGNDLVAWKDSGGLWRLGHEYLGGSFRETARASDNVADVTAQDDGDVLHIQIRLRLLGAPFVRHVWLRRGTPWLRLQTVGIAPRAHSVTTRFETTMNCEHVTMNVPGGIVTRAPVKLTNPTFWPARSFIHLRDRHDDRGLALFMGGPAAAALTTSYVVDLLGFRNAPRELAFGVLPVLAHPASGTEPYETSFDFAVLPTPRGDYLDNRLPHKVRRALRSALFAPNVPELDEIANNVILADHEHALVSAIKLADRGGALVVRLRWYGRQAETVGLLCPARQIQTATLCDALERDLAALTVRKGRAEVPLCASLTSVRLSF